jgi:hypothetical protein
MRKPAICYMSREWLAMTSRSGTLLPNGKYVPARAEPFHSIAQRWVAVWLVLTGKADALVWPGQ